MTIGQGAARATTWLSIGLAQLADHLALGQERPEPASKARLAFDFDVVIVGSGYGGSIALEELAGHAVDGHPLRIAMLERGQEYVPGAFASASAELPGELRFATSGATAVKGKPEGLFDVRIGPDVNVILASGLGGGSLINAGVMMRPDDAVMQDGRWPKAIRKDPALPTLFDEAREKLRATLSSALPTQRTQVMDRLGRGGISAANGRSKAVAAQPVFITVATQDDPGIGVAACNSCGDCATGCNTGAKVSVDVSLIAQARRRHPDDGSLQVVTDASVVNFEALSLAGAGWAVDVVHTAPDLRRHQTRAYRLFARRLVIAAGTLGSTELLMRARQSGLAVSDKLGGGFSGNGDMIFALRNLPMKANGVADETAPFAQRHVGPTITRMIDCRGDGDLDAVVQDLGVPGGLRRVFEECVTTASAVRSLGTSDATVYSGAEVVDLDGLSADATDRMMAIAVIVDDGARGRMTLPAGTADLEQGTLGVVWPELRQADWPERCQAALERRVGNSLPGATLEANPAWRPLSPSLEQLFGRTRGATTSVHPLGGCRMADSIGDGVVDACGQVFKDANGGVHEGLVVLDGAIAPMALGINPALTISTIALRAIRWLRDEKWQFMPAAESSPGWRAQRPRFAIPEPVRPQDTVLEIVEKVKTTIRVASQQGARTVNAELELWFKPAGIQEFIAASSPRVLHIDPDRSRLFVRPPPEPADLCVPIDGKRPAGTNPGSVPPWVTAPVSGTLTLMRHEASTPALRRTRAIAAWVHNRGLRDAAQAVSDLLRGRPVTLAGPLQLLSSLWRMASRAGDARLLAYDLKIGKPIGEVDSSAGDASRWEGHSIRAAKRVTYECSGNPSRQLSEARITAFPNWVGGAPDSVLRVDPSYWVSMGVPLLRIVSQRDSPTALRDLASLALYLARTILPLHCLTLRLPDRPQRPPWRLPPDLSRSRAFPRLDFVELEVAPHSSAGVVKIRLSRYRPTCVSRPNPVMLIHGYSASGTTFVHEALPEGGLVGALCGAGHDVWVLDLRSSAGMPTAQVEWRFEDMGLHDIPLAVGHILERTGAQKVDIVAHCMGAAMLSLGLLMPVPRSRARGAPPPVDATLPLREHLGRVVLSQVGPTMVVTPANSARAYIVQWLRHFVRLGRYEFTPESPTVTDDMIDRLLCALPCSKEDFALENPILPLGKRTPWVGARHRMDALYGRTFQLAGLDDAVLERIDDFFGPLDLQTLAQVISFARCDLVTDVHGNGSFVQAATLARFDGSPVLSLHSTLNGLFDFQTRANALELFRRAGLKGYSVALEGMGHQDSLIGREAPRVYDLIRRFLAGEEVS